MASVTSCNESISLQRYIEPSIICTKDKEYPSAAEEKKRFLSTWIPCNDVDWIDDSADLFGAGQSNSAEALEGSNYARVFRDWLGSADRFSPSLAAQVFKDLDKPFSASKNNPILETALAQSVKNLIRGAIQSI